MDKINQPEVWMRGPVVGVPPLLQPVAHALLQANEEIHAIMEDFPESLLWERPSGVASPGFHLKHIPGVVDRLYTYADGKALSPEQLKYLSEEGLPDQAITKEVLLEALDAGISQFIDELRKIDEVTLTQYRPVGRRKLPSTLLGLLFHSAEHTMRHTGQLLVTVRVLKSSGSTQ